MGWGVWQVWAGEAEARAELEVVQPGYKERCTPGGGGRGVS